MKSIFQVQSDSSNEVYNVYFSHLENMTTIVCDCKAGQNKMLCKHIKMLLEGDVSSIKSDSQISELKDFLSVINLGVYEDFSKSVGENEKEIKRIQKEQKKLKKDIITLLNTGF